MRLVEVDTPNVENIKKWLAQHGIRKYTFNNGVIDVSQSVNIIQDDNIETLPVQFGTISGSFCISSCDRLKSIVNCPHTVLGNFYVVGCMEMTTLGTSPEFIKGNFICTHNISLQNLDGIQKMKSCYDFICKDNINLIKFTDSNLQLEVNGNVDCSDCHKLQSVLGGPMNINGIYNVINCPSITNLLQLCNVLGIKGVLGSGKIGDIMTNAIKNNNEYQAQNDLFDAGYDSMANF